MTDRRFKALLILTFIGLALPVTMLLDCPKRIFIVIFIWMNPFAGINLLPVAALLAPPLVAMLSRRKNRTRLDSLAALLLLLGCSWYVIYYDFALFSPFSEPLRAIRVIAGESCTERLPPGTQWYCLGYLAGLAVRLYGTVEIGRCLFMMQKKPG